MHTQADVLVIAACICHKASFCVVRVITKVLVLVLLVSGVIVITVM